MPHKLGCLDQAEQDCYSVLQFVCLGWDPTRADRSDIENHHREHVNVHGLFGLVINAGPTIAPIPRQWKACLSVAYRA